MHKTTSGAAPLALMHADNVVPAFRYLRAVQAGDTSAARRFGRKRKSPGHPRSRADSQGSSLRTGRQTFYFVSSSSTRAEEKIVPASQASLSGPCFGMIRRRRVQVSPWSGSSISASTQTPSSFSENESRQSLEPRSISSEARPSDTSDRNSSRYCWYVMIIGTLSASTAVIVGGDDADRAVIPRPGVHTLGEHDLHSARARVGERVAPQVAGRLAAGRSTRATIQCLVDVPLHVRPA